MSEILLIVPSRGRPHNANALIESWMSTTEGRSRLAFFLDDDDPTAPDYPDDTDRHLRYADVWVRTGPPSRLAAWTNRVATSPLADPFTVLASIGDDHRFESPRWESAFLEAIDDMGGTGVVYGDDGVHHERIPTAFFVTSNIIRELGAMGPPGVQHLFFDDWARELGRASGCLRYLPDVHIAHHHPIVGKAPMDATYLAGGENKALFASDKRAYETWRTNGLQTDAAKVRALRKVTA